MNKDDAVALIAPKFAEMATMIRDLVPEGRNRALALTHLEDSLIRVGTAFENPYMIL